MAAYFLVRREDGFLDSVVTVVFLAREAGFLLGADSEVGIEGLERGAGSL